MSKPLALNAKQYSDSGSPLLVLHGLFGNLGNWGWHSGMLAQENAVYGLDLRNHGSSPRSSTMNYQAMANDVAHFIEQKNLGPCQLLGHSMGGKVAMQLALETPTLASKLLVVDIAPVSYPPDSAGHLDVFAAMDALDLDSINSRKGAEQILHETIADEETRLFLLSDLRRNKNGKFRWRLNYPVLRDSYELLRQNVPADGPFLGDTLFVKGGESSYILEEHRGEILSRFPNARSKLVLNAGHWLHSQKPQAFLKIAQQFFGDETNT